MNPKVDTYLAEGCGRCAHYQTPECKVHRWSQELRLLRRIVLDCGLEEELKWSQPCYTIQNKNILLVTAFKEYAALAFFKGALLPDPDGLLIRASESSQSARTMRFTNADEIERQLPHIKRFIFDAIELEKEGKKVVFEKNPEPIPLELQEKMDENQELKVAFERLTAGRQRGYILHFSKPKQSKTRLARIEKCTPKILKGEGLNDDYKSRSK